MPQSPASPKKCASRGSRTQRFVTMTTGRGAPEPQMMMNRRSALPIAFILASLAMRCLSMKVAVTGTTGRLGRVSDE